MNDAEWFAEHTAYLATAEWAFRRGQVLHRDGYRCQARLPGCGGEASQVHHLTYKHWRNEPLFDLIAVCGLCHEEITAMDRSKRASEGRSDARPKPSYGVDVPGIQEDARLPRSRQIRNLLLDGPKNLFELRCELGIEDSKREYERLRWLLGRMTARAAVTEFDQGDGEPRWRLPDSTEEELIF